MVNSLCVKAEALVLGRSSLFRIGSWIFDDLNSKEREIISAYESYESVPEKETELLINTAWELPNFLNNLIICENKCRSGTTITNYLCHKWFCISSKLQGVNIVCQ